MQESDPGILKDITESLAIFQDYMKNDILDILTASAQNIRLDGIGLSCVFAKTKYNQSQNNFINLHQTYNSTALISIEENYNKWLNLSKIYLKIIVFKKGF